MKRFVWLLVILLLNMACTQPEVVETTPVVVETAVSTTAPTITPTILPTASPIPPTVVVSTSTPIPTTTPPEKVLTICQAQEPDSLYMYESSMLAAQHVRHAIYENLVTNLDFSYQAQGIEKLPSLADGDALLESVEVQVGDMVVDADGNVVPLAAGIAVRTVDGQRITADDSPRIMSQLSATFTLKPLVWSDGTAVSASDSVFSFEANRAANTFRNADKIARTAVYEATGDLTLRWVGLPGYLDQTYFLNVWSPLPRHQLGQYALDTLAALAEVRERPLSSGPFVITEWEPRRQITLSQNPYYYRTDEGLPKLDRVVYRFIPDSNALNAELLAGNCHVGTQDSTNMGQVPFLQQSNAQGLLTPHITSGTVWEHIDFGIDSAGAYGDGNGRPDWFEDVRVRQAMMMCTNRQQIVDEVLYGAAELTHAYVPDNHPLMPTDLQQWPYDVAAANALLDEVGYTDVDGDGIRETTSGSPFQIALSSTIGGELRQAVSQVFVQNMRDCGIVVAEEWFPAGEMFADGPDGPVFGRQFDLALFAWLTNTDPHCNLWHSDNITGEEADGFGGWSNSGNTGWHNDAFDAACGVATTSLPGMSTYETAHQDALRIFAEDLPVMPLFFRLKISVTRPEVLNFHLNSSENSELWNLYEIDLLVD